MNKILTLVTAILISVLLFTTCKKQDTTLPVNDQPISISITADGQISVDAAVR